MRLDAASSAIVFPVFLLGFAAFWTAIVTLLGAISGWYGLAQRFPNRREPSLLKIGGQSGSMGMGVSLSGILTLEACSTGLRVSVWRIFGPFSRPFFVPWDEVRPQEQKVLIFDRIKLHFGRPEEGTLSVFPCVWQMLQAVRECELGRTSTERLRSAFRAMILEQWLFPVAVTGAFFSIVPRIANPGAAWPPLAVTIGFPAIIFGIGPLIQYFRLRSRL